MRIYEMVIRTDTQAYIHTGMYKNKKDALTQGNGNGKVVSIDDITERTPLSIQCIYDQLIKRFGVTETKAICDCVFKNYENTVN